MNYVDKPWQKLIVTLWKRVMKIKKQKKRILKNFNIKNTAHV